VFARSPLVGSATDSVTLVDPALSTALMKPNVASVPYSKANAVGKSCGLTVPVSVAPVAVDLTRAHSSFAVRHQGKPEDKSLGSGLFFLGYPAPRGPL
jgi:hypothetical protein